MAGSTSGITNQASGMMGSFVGGGGSGKIPTGMRDMINGIDNGGSLQNSLSQGGSAISDLPQNRAVPMPAITPRGGGNYSWCSSATV